MCCRRRKNVRKFAMWAVLVGGFCALSLHFIIVTSFASSLGREREREREREKESCVVNKMAAYVRSVHLYNNSMQRLFVKLSKVLPHFDLLLLLLLLLSLLLSLLLLFIYSLILSFLSLVLQLIKLFKLTVIIIIIILVVF